MLTTPDLNEEKRSAFDLVTKVRDTVLRSREPANEFTTIAHDKNNKYKNVNKRIVSFNICDLVILLLPRKCVKLLVEWQGPDKIIEKVSDVDYRIDVNGKHKIYHVDMIAKYHTNKIVDVKETNSSILIHDCHDDKHTERKRQDAV